MMAEMQRDLKPFDRAFSDGDAPLDITPQMVRDTAAWCQLEDELRDTLRLAALALNVATAPRSMEA